MTHKKQETREPMPAGHLYDQEHARSADEALQELRRDYNALLEDAKRLRYAMLGLRRWVEHLQEVEDESEFRDFWKALHATSETIN